MRPLPGRTLVFASAPLLNQFETYYPHIRRIAQVIPPGVRIPASLPDQQTSRRSVGWSLDSPWLLFVANDYQRKGLTTVLQALQTLPREVQLAVVGQNRQQARFEALAINLGVASRVHFFGPRQDVEVLMSAADVLVHPTTEDSFGMVVLEAMAQGLPVVVSAAPHCGLSAELSHLHDAWMLSDPQENEGLAQAVQAILTQSDLRSHLIQGGRAQAQGRTWVQAALKWHHDVLCSRDFVRRIGQPFVAIVSVGFPQAILVFVWGCQLVPANRLAHARHRRSRPKDEPQPHRHQ
jgi:UDP-glucose:(heptosyl)LPS alpha-1,3-glucosyltransferase